MNVKRFTARTSRDALAQVRSAFGDDAVVLSTKPCADGVEVLAMAPEGMQQIEHLSHTAPRAADPALAARSAARPFAARVAERTERIEPALPTPEVDEDVEALSMSTLSFQDYVRERMLRRRQAAMNEQAGIGAVKAKADKSPEPVSPLGARLAAGAAARPAPAMREPAPREPALREPLLREPPVLHDAVRAAASEIHVPALAAQAAASTAAAASSRRDQQDMMNELRSMKGLIEERFGALAFMEKMQRQPKQAMLTQKLLDCGFSPALIHKLADSMPADVADETAWAAGVLERNLVTAESDSPLEDLGGVYALVGATGVGKTTTTAKIAAAFATKYGAGNLGLITLDAYRVGAHEQLRAYGRILGVPVHTAHDRASLDDLLELLAAKKMVLIDTAGMAQRDTRTRELLDMLSHPAISRLLVVNAASQGETVEDVLVAYRANTCCGIVLSKMDEAVKLGPALDALIRHKLKVVGVANGQRVPEDWHRLTGNALVQRALRGGGSSAWRLDSGDVNLIFTAPQIQRGARSHGAHA